MEVVKNEDGSFSIIQKTLLTLDEVNFLKEINDRGYWEFRDYNEKDNKVSICNKLLAIGILDIDTDAWHITFIITEKGSNIIKLADL